MYVNISLLQATLWSFRLEIRRRCLSLSSSTEQIDRHTVIVKIPIGNKTGVCVSSLALYCSYQTDCSVPT